MGMMFPSGAEHDSKNRAVPRESYPGLAPEIAPHIPHSRSSFEPTPQNPTWGPQTMPQILNPSLVRPMIPTQTMQPPGPAGPGSVPWTRQPMNALPHHLPVANHHRMTPQGNLPSTTRNATTNLTVPMPAPSHPPPTLRVHAGRSQMSPPGPPLAMGSSTLQQIKPIMNARPLYLPSASPPTGSSRRRSE